MALVVTRFAPSPTGHLHIGGARSALFCWAYAHRARLDGHDGRFMIRIEDTDQARSSDESARGILEDLAWLGIEWDDGPELVVDRPSGAEHASEKRATRTIGGDSRGVGPYFQARRRNLYDLYARQLVESGRAYPAFETAAELEAKRREAVAKKQTYRYDRAAYRAIPTPAARLAAMKEADASGGGKPYVVRFLAPAEAVTVHDQVLGDVTYGAGEMDDFVIRKADGFPTYHFAVVIDDELMGVTHVMRAQEHLNNTPRHVAMQAALRRHDTGAAFRVPVYAHMPLIFNMDGSKMSKRDKAKAARVAAKAAIQKGSTAAALAADTSVPEAQVAAFLAGDSDALDVAAALAKRFGLALPEIEVSDFREAGYLPEAIVNFLGLLGWSPGTKDEQGKDTEKFGMDFLAKQFSVERIGRTNAKFDRVKLLSFNADYLKALPDGEFVRRWREWLGEYAPPPLDAASKLDDRAMALLAPALKPRARTFGEALKGAEFALVADDAFAYDAKAVEKVLTKGEPTGLSVLRDLRPALAALASFEPAAVHAALESFASGRGLEMGKIAQPLRVALTGSGVSPPIEATLAVLGRERVLRRIERCLGEAPGGPWG